MKLQVEHKLPLKCDIHRGFIILSSLLLNTCEIFHNEKFLKKVSLNTFIFDNPTKVSKL